MEYVKALCLLRDAHSRLFQYCPSMLSRNEWNLAGRTAYDAMESVALAVESLIGFRLPKVGHHGVRIPESALSHLPVVAWRVSDDPANSTSVVAHKQTSPDNHIRLMKCICGVVTLLANCPVISLSDISFSKEESTLCLYSGNHRIYAVTDTSVDWRLDGIWFQVVITAEHLRILNKYLEPIPIGRNQTAYYARVYSRTESELICKQANELFLPMKRRIGHKIGSMDWLA